MKSLVIGAAIVDIIMRIPQLPKKGEDTYCKESNVTVGGCAYNVANILRNFNVDYNLFAPVGKGMNASIIKEALRSKHHEILISETEQDNGQCLCLVEDDGERTFVTQVGLEGHYKKEWFNQIDMDHYDQIYIDGYLLSSNSGEIIVNWLEDYKEKEIYFAPGPVMNMIDSNIIERVFKLQPILHLNEMEALHFTEEVDINQAVKKLFSMTSYNIIVTLGPRGSLFFDGREINHIEGEHAKVVDTIGAGDSHIASIMAAVSLGYNFIDACYIGNKVAAQIVQVQGPTIDEEQFDKESFLM